MKKSTLSLIAEKAKVGIATVDRVINERGGVSPKTAEKVIKAARDLNFNRILPEIYQPPWEVEIILSTNPSSFFKYILSGFNKIIKYHQYRNVRLRYTLISEENPDRLASHLFNSSENFDGIIVFANDTPEIYSALEECYKKGTPVITLATDLPFSKRLCHVGIDQYQIGRTAASLMVKTAQNYGNILLISGRFDYQAHIQRMRGFTDVIKSKENFCVSQINYGNDNPDIIAKLLVEYKSRSLVGIYNSGAGNSAIGAWLKMNKNDMKCSFISHEIYETTTTLLEQGILSFALDQNALRHAELSLDIMFNYLSGNLMPSEYGDGKVNFNIFTDENLY
ncbi:LacI family DNA-binding transcriptional regulator [Vibrio viridaestus]|uniref:Autoinducer 2-binding periplasmic protein LuxP n=1 Tax=Vibrio viridaestus TaxID=2487322 RepID=A0A3N9TW93_9VIBR|nr:LacI family DNA-binding transcriptional regulator [Vibrio viridaestus]RQW61182.1 LacI family transcriptional regulator [Vibrio viridaestus]